MVTSLGISVAQADVLDGIPEVGEEFELQPPGYLQHNQSTTRAQPEHNPVHIPELWV